MGISVKHNAINVVIAIRRRAAFFKSDGIWFDVAGYRRRSLDDLHILQTGG
ncbi:MULTISPECIES: hypothetical protein [Rhizobium]|uniref:hypothetical protein n=1 Tax=Rhizobium TaxID=379 RepID=UPI001959F0F2|nr:MULTISPECIES: hypothetical protein [Rhizobium]MBM7049773.1 hypothetical protein [Rhizobium lusitanum]